jgi:hypothetical protein
VRAFFDTTRGQITIGEIPPIRRAALAAVGKKARVALLADEIPHRLLMGISTLRCSCKHISAWWIGTIEKHALPGCTTKY